MGRASGEQGKAGNGAIDHQVDKRLIGPSAALLSGGLIGHNSLRGAECLRGHTRSSTCAVCKKDRAASQ
jgi:hypothetical protein